ncbi:MAG: FAD-dependent oxidoreductase [Actinophytocola sp.]|uniref:NAD(P)/FAD-dependent oxidoreductase n=1 Tax=Actinophytocola sp. TaxID=1872138 RepID=UPI001327CA7E|nr:FAD-dependent oxidoreductase [Actinophytocola sp.]MPZ84184.1 FAD-dependent oxidoreductase [Actinophytocola sp.]
MEPALSFWLSTLDLTPRAPLPGDTSVDVAVVGAGYTGLWTAYYLSVADPSLRIAVVEARFAGFGASGRNGGWCSSLFPVSPAALARRHGRDAALALTRAMESTVDEVGRVAAAEGIDCHFAKGGTVVLARTPVQEARAHEEVASAASFGVDASWLSAAEARARCGATSVRGGVYTPSCAAIHPARLARGLAEAVERRGVTVYEQTRALSLRAGAVVTDRGTVRAPVIVRATEGYTPGLFGQRRTLVPLYSLMVATEPLPASFWATAGLARRETFADFRRMIIYGQRTADDRLAFGGRGAPYHFGSRVEPSFERDGRVHAAIERTLVDLFPALGPKPPVTHRWGGPLGVPRDWTASVGFDRRAGLAWAGGYVGDGVGTSNLAGRTLADLVTGTAGELTRLPWVGHRSRRWEPEPLRWLGINAGLRVMSVADTREDRTGRPFRPAALFTRFLGE